VSRGQKTIFTILIVILVCMVSYMLMLAVGEMPAYGALDNPTNNEVWHRYVEKGVEESGGLNLVTNILLDYRAYDTLLETTVLFTAVMAIMLVLGVSGKSRH
jgi:multisubunit Na+/H+ antiporter MnhB subunit